MEEEEEIKHRGHMHQFALEQAANKCSLVLSRKKYESIVWHLLNLEAKIEPQLKHWIKHKKFHLAYVTGDESDPILTIPSLESRNLGEGKEMRLQVVHADQIFDIVHDIHTKELNHSGYKKLLDYIQRYYYGITRGFLQEFTRTCPVCSRNRPTTLISPKEYNNKNGDVMTIVKVISKHEIAEEDVNISTQSIDAPESSFTGDMNMVEEEEEVPTRNKPTLLHKMSHPLNHLNNDVQGKVLHAAAHFFENYKVPHQHDSDDVDEAFVNYLVKELKSIKNPSVKKRLKKKIIDIVLEVQDEDV